jgi:hypothetical protein
VKRPATIAWPEKSEPFLAQASMSSNVGSRWVRPRACERLRHHSQQGFPLATQMTNGRPVIVDKIAITPLLNEQIRRLESQDGVEATLLMCTGPFPQLGHARPLLQPHAALYGAVAGIAGEHQVSSLMLRVPHNSPMWRRPYASASR